ncbi:Dihydrofolate reductase [Friedmanniella luteola]|uniref:Dihydrofolate reductase n=1 Tax=Friedmanniella luteola TaxID=546871 RepID=A0A1H1T4K5_9ACTN|nr:dihydrofolate reductase family protein [Friedmanniella luteola]SDS55138.1 Dihydrofolate reductase [Friedmanniella luteola]
MTLRKLVVTQNITLDGVIDMAENWDNISARVAAGADEQVAALQEQAAESDALLVGRKTFTDLRGYWPNVEDDETGNTAHLNSVAKYVLSSTLTDPEWENSTIIRGLDDVRALQEESGQDIVVTGSIQLTHALIEAGLVDEYRLFVFPAIVGHGARLFEGSASLPPLQLLQSQSFANGVVLSTYAVQR